MVHFWHISLCVLMTVNLSENPIHSAIHMCCMLDDCAAHLPACERMVFASVFRLSVETPVIELHSV